MENKIKFFILQRFKKLENGLKGYREGVLDGINIIVFLKYEFFLVC